MRKSFLLSGILLASVLTLRCDGKKVDDDDDDAGESGESGEGGTAGKGAATGGKGGAAGSATAMGGASGSSAPGSGGGSSGAKASGGSGDQGGTGGSGESGMGGEPGAGGTTGGSDSAGGTTGGSDSTGGTTGGSDSTGGTTGGSDSTGGTGGGSGGMGAGGKAGAGGSAGKGGSGGMGSAGKGGSGGMGSAGKGGSAGAGAGAGGSAGGLSCGPGEGLALTSEPGTAGNTGWIEGDNNCVGIQGAVLVDMDLVGSSITLTETDGTICVSGHAEQVQAGDFTDYWGAFVSIQLNNPGTGTAGPYNASTHGVDGFKFSLSGSDIPVEIRPTLMVNGSTTIYCKQVCDDGAQSILLSQAHADCWEGTAGATPGATALTYLRFAIPSIEASDVTFDFCIDGLTAITDNVSVGDPGICPVPPSGDSCVGRCGTYDLDLECQCDNDCTGAGDCCADYVDECLSDG